MGATPLGGTSSQLPLESTLVSRKGRCCPVADITAHHGTQYHQYGDDMHV